MKIFTIIGLIFDIRGVLMLFQYGLPSRPEVGDIIIADESIDDELNRDKENRRIKKLAYIGLSFILLGLQNNFFCFW
jgi:hypothetical protein